MTKYINWYIFLVINYYCFGNLIIKKFPYLGVKYEIVGFLMIYHDFISFCSFLVAFLSFVISLKQGYLKYQFRLFGWVCMACVFITYQGWLLVHNVFEGLAWYLIPALLIIVNDIFAYIVGYFFGKTPLIALSPKKTWEGFIGGAFFTFLFSLVLTSAFQSIPGTICPVK